MKLNKLIFSFLLTFMALQDIDLKAQIAYYREVYYSVDTLYLKPRSNRVMINVGAQADINGDASGTNIAPYLYARAQVSRFLFSGLVSALPGTSYNIQEATVVFCFKGASEKPKSGVTVGDMGVRPIKFKTGGKHKYISPEDYSFTTTKEDVSYRGPTMNAPGGTKVTTTTTTKHSGTKNVKRKEKSTAYLNVPLYTRAGFSIGAFHWARPNNISKVSNAQGISFGFVATTNQKARYRFHYRVKENDVDVNGLGNYDVRATDRIYKRGTKIGRVNSSIDFAMEFLYSPIVLLDKPQYLQKSQTDTTGKLVDIKKKNFGFRFRAEVRKGIVSMRYEVGLRPGVKARVGGIDGEDNVATRLMGGAYVLVGLGIGIGAL